jgi:hypothetical protein
MDRQEAIRYLAGRIRQVYDQPNAKRPRWTLTDAQAVAAVIAPSQSRPMAKPRRSARLAYDCKYVYISGRLYNNSMQGPREANCIEVRQSLRQWYCCECGSAIPDHTAHWSGTNAGFPRLHLDCGTPI